MTTLDAIFEGWSGRVIHKWKHYFDIYDRHLRQLRDQPVTLLEIGLGEGGSLGMWREYLGAQARIVGIDVSPRCEAYRDDGFEIHIGDQGDPVFLERILESLPGLDIVIDDGGHTASQQIASFETLYPHLGPSGIYLVEDTHTSYWAQFQDRPDGRTWMEYAKSLCDDLNAWHFDIARFHRYALPPATRPGTLDVPWITRNTRSVTFYDSIVVVERATVGEPWHTRRPRSA